MKELKIDAWGDCDYEENSPDVFNTIIRTDQPYTAEQLLEMQDIHDEVKILSGNVGDEDDLRWSLAIREIASDIGDKKVTFRINEHGTLYTELE